MKRLIISLYGMDRSLNETGKSIRDKIITPAQNLGWECVLVHHFNFIEGGGNSRALNIDGVDFEISCYEKQSFDKIKLNMDAIPPCIKPEIDGQKIYRNWLYDQHSLRRLWIMLSLIPDDESNIYLIIRPDVLIVDDFDLEDIAKQLEAGGVELVTPSWHRFRGMNDRVAFCSRGAAMAYCNRLADLPDFLEKFGFFHPEMHLKFSMEKHGYQSGSFDTRAVRIRANGNCARLDLGMLPDGVLRPSGGNL